MSHGQWSGQNRVKNYFLLPNEIYHIGLSAGAIAVYGYLLSIEDRTTYQCHVSTKKIGHAARMSENTVRKYVAELEEKRLITTEPTTVRDRNGRKQNGSLLYTIRPFREAVEHFHQRQLDQLSLEAERRRVELLLQAQEQSTPWGRL